MSTKLKLFVGTQLSEDERETLGLGIKPENFPGSRATSASVSERAQIRESLPAVTVGSTRYEYPRELVNEMGGWVESVTAETIQTAKDVAERTDTSGSDSVHSNPNPEGVESFLKDNQGEAVFIDSVE